MSAHPAASSEPAPGAAGAPALELRDVTKSFGRKEVLQGLDLAVARGETFTILGGSGSGKSVSLKLMIGLLRPDSGRVFFEGRDVTDLAESEWVEVRKQMGFVFQGAALFDSLSVYENVAYPLREHWRRDEAEVAERVRFCLEAVDLEGTEPLMPAELSGGMRKRVGVARAIALEPHVILYDEPTTGLDPANSRRVGELIGSLRERLGVTSVVVTHELELCFAISDRVGLLKQGRIVAQGTPEEMRATDRREVVEFLSGVADEDPPVRGIQEDAHGV